jgi:putative methyltransferase (TIGR04325 family)
MASLGVCLDDLGDTKVSVLDLGGGYGHYFGIAVSAFPTRHWNWTICEIPVVVGAALSMHPPPTLRWVDQSVVEGHYDIGLASGSLQYLEEPFGALDWLATRCKYLIINRTPLWPVDYNTISCQIVGGASAYPAWFLSRVQFDRYAREVGEILFEWENIEDQAYFAGCRAAYSGMLIQVHA